MTYLQRWKTLIFFWKLPFLKLHTFFERVKDINVFWFLNLSNPMCYHCNSQFPLLLDRCSGLLLLIEVVHCSTYYCCNGNFCITVVWDRNSRPLLIFCYFTTHNINYNITNQPLHGKHYNESSTTLFLVLEIIMASEFRCLSCYHIKNFYQPWH